jgi:GNAT superfamily N-acetyltransferase
MLEDGKVFSMGCAEASNMGNGEWYFNRAYVRPEHQKKGIGKTLVVRLLAETTKQGCTKLVLTPGGYNTPYKQQEAFYLKCGFRRIKRGLLEYP